MKKIVFKAGYTLEVESWENDGDNYRTKYCHVDTIEGVKATLEVCKNLFGMGESSPYDISNCGHNSCKDYTDTVKEFFDEHKDIKKYFEIEGRELSDNDLVTIIQDLGYDLMGSSEYYDFRVCESISILYTPVDIMMEEIKLK